MEPLDGIEPSTYSLRVNCSTPELQRPKSIWEGKIYLAQKIGLASSTMDTARTARQMSTDFLRSFL